MEFYYILAVISAGFIAPLLFSLLFGVGYFGLSKVFLGLLLFLASFILAYLFSRVLAVVGVSGVLFCCIMGLLVAVSQRVLVALGVNGLEASEAVWVGFGFGLAETICSLIPNAPIHLIFAGSALTHFYRRLMSSLFQAASAMVLSRTSLYKLAVLSAAQAIGFSIALAGSYGFIQAPSIIQHIIEAGVLASPLAMMHSSVHS